MQLCDHTAVGALIYNAQGELLMFQRRTPPWGIAGPGGHCDGDSPESGVRRETFEEVGLTVIQQLLVASFRITKPCRRPYTGEGYHDWHFYQVIVRGALQPCEQETREVRWYSPQEIRVCMTRTEDYHLHYTISEQSYQDHPGLDYSWYFLFKNYPALLEFATFSSPS